ncbi:hypothetical protein P3T23_000313 [Paraburkholderia sp. GAS448]|uniref:DUF3443 family protein n=1 Tax=Paraburkholderia sp. GAS448 TaxID=3035136 RepID=UPI003D21A75E
MKNLFWALSLALLLCACGGGGGDASTPAASNSSPATPAVSSANTVPVTIDGSYSAVNVPYVTITVCAPGTTNCATVDHVLVDSMSTGLRLLSSALPSDLGLPTVADPASGNPLAECAEFGSGFTFGPLTKLDLTIGLKTAHGLTAQLINDSFATVPCTGTSAGAGGTATLLAKGIIGMDTFREDCGTACTVLANTDYYACAGTTCSPAVVQPANQVTNPVLSFASDNNGIALTFPAVPATGANAISGTLIFGINTQANNARGSATVLATDAYGNVSATYKGTPLPSFFDSGSSVYFFTDATIPGCGAPLNSPNQWYCPATDTAESATIVGVTGAMVANFSIGNALSLLTTTNKAFDNTGVDLAVLGTPALDLGMPYFYGKTIYFGIQGADMSTASGAGYFAL